MKAQADDEVAKLFAEWVFRVYHAIQREPVLTNRPRVESHGFHVLYLLSRAQNHQLSQSFLLTELQTTNPQMSKIISELEGEGFLERVRKEKDRRHVYVHLTEAGHTYFKSCADTVIAAIAAEFSRQPREKIKLVDALLHQLMEEPE